MNVRGLVAALCVTVAMGLGTGACSSRDGAGASASHEDTGSVTAALTAIGPDGATYGLSPNAFLSVSWTGNAGSGSSTFFFDPSLTTQTFSLPVGTYTATLLNATPLTRSADAGATSVPATLVDPQPYAFTISQGQTTPLTFHFAIQSIENVTFSTGSLNTGLQVDASAAAASNAQASGSSSVLPVLNGPPGLDSALASMAPLAVSYSIVATLTSPFAASVDGACANITASISTTGGMSSAEQNAAALINETSGGTGSLCLWDTNKANESGQVQLFFQRFGAAQTPQISAALGSSAGSPSNEFAFSLFATPPAPLYDGSTANLAQLSQPLTMPVFSLDVSYLPNETFVQAHAVPVIGTAGTVTLQLTP